MKRTHQQQGEKMKTRHVLNQLPEYLSGELEPAERSVIDRHLRTCKSCRAEYASLQQVWLDLGRVQDAKPDPRVRERFFTELELLKSADQRRRSPNRTLLERINRAIDTIWPRQPALQVALAVVCLVVGYAVGFRTESGTGSNGEVAQLRSEVVNMQRLVMMSLLKTESASERIRGANWTERISRPDQEVFSQLFETLNYDPEVNVRLAALEALAKYYDQAEVKKGIINSLLHQTSPLVQLTLIQVIATVHDADGVAAMKELLKDKDLNKTVRAQVEKKIKELGA